MGWSLRPYREYPVIIDLGNAAEIPLKAHHAVADTPFIVQLSVSPADRIMGVYQ